MTRDHRHFHPSRGAGRALRLLISCNQALFHAADEHELLSGVCRLVVETGGYLMAWVGGAGQDESKSILPLASYGYEQGYLEQLRLTWADTERGRAPTGTAIRTRTPQVNRNFLTNPALTPWRELAVKRGYQSSIALPLSGNGAMLGALSIYAKEPDAFDPEEVRLLEELARDLAFGMVTLRVRAESARLREEVSSARAALEDSREQYRRFVELSNEGIWSLNAELRTDFVNPALCRMLGYSANEMLGRPVSDFVLADEQEGANEAQDERMQHPDEHLAAERRFRRKDGSVRWGLVSATWLKDMHGVVQGGFAMVTDITERKLAEGTLRNSEQRFHTLFDRASEGIAIVSLEGRLVSVNEAFARMHGYTVAEMPGMSLSQIDTPESLAQAPERMRRIREEGALTFEVENVHKDGHVVPMEVSASLVTVNGETVVQSFSRDITERRKAEEALQLAALVFDNAGEGVLVTDEHNRIMAANPAFSRITGYSFEEVKGRDPKMFSSGRHDKEFYGTMWKEIHESGFWQGEIWDRNKGGDIHAKHLTISVIRGKEGRPHRYVALFTDITQKKQSEELIWRQANFDGLTGLPNRQMFHDRLEQEARKSHRSGKALALLLVDLDRFKEVNDTLGHHKGDMLLVDAAQRIGNCVRESDTVARLGGDEFVVILSELDELDNIDRIAQELVDTLAAPFKLGLDEVFVSASIGISSYPADTANLDGLLKNADQAMYSAKNAGRNRFSYFTPDMQEAAQKRLRLAAELRAALAQGQFLVYYQPVVELATGRIWRAEALLRWRHPERGMVDPRDFIPLAEDTGLIVPIGDWVFREAAQQAKRWLAVCDPFQVSVNKSPVQIRHNLGGMTSWPEHLRQLGLPGSAVTVEITESILMNAEAPVNEKLQAFRDAGIQLAIDDFGTGYSSLAYLRDFDIDCLKIDRSFVNGLEANGDNQGLCEAIIVMAHKLGMKVVAEGVETAAQRDLLLASGCDFAQGWLFGKPMPAEEFETLLAARR